MPRMTDTRHKINRIADRLISEQELAKIGEELALKNPHIGHKGYPQQQFERDIAQEFARVSRYSLYGAIQ